MNPEGRTARAGTAVPVPSPGYSHLGSRSEAGGPTPDEVLPQREGQEPRESREDERQKPVCLCVSVCVCVCVCVCVLSVLQAPHLSGWRGAIKVGRPSPGLSLKLGRRKGKKLCC